MFSLVLMFKFLKILFFLLCAGEAQAAVNVVVVAPQEGKYAQYGKEVVDGVNIAVKDVNSKGGILGQKINLIVADDRCNDTYAITMAQMLSLKSDEDKIDLVVGPYCLNKFSDISNIYADNNIAQIAINPLTSEARALNVIGYHKEQAKTFFDFYKLRYSGKSVALIYDLSDNNLVNTIIDVQGLFEQSHLSDVLSVYSLEKYGFDYDALAKDVSKNDVVYILADSDKVNKIAGKLISKNDNIVIFRDRYSVVEGEKNLDKQFFLGLRNIKNNPYFTETLVDLRLKSMEPVGLGVYSFASLRAWANVVNKAKTLDANIIRNIILGSSDIVPWKGDNNSQLYGIYEVNDEEYTQVY
ncbi:MAG: amino acid ABC transporter substrate-binding protein [Alphaproteobacteria bacterium]|nr:amino acid ABC transporter substrate-binding protein [Alphaproteobacteria bacterium]